MCVWPCINTKTIKNVNCLYTKKVLQVGNFENGALVYCTVRMEAFKNIVAQNDSNIMVHLFVVCTDGCNLYVYCTCTCSV